MTQERQWFYKSNEYSRPVKKWVSYWTLIIVIITTFVLALIIYKNIWKISEMFGGNIDIQQSTWLKIWKTISVSWEITPDGDYITHTHKLNTLKYGILWIKSRSIDLNQYQWNILIQWIVEKQQDWLFIIEVNNVSWSVLDDSLADSWLVQDISPNWQYLSNAWIYFPVEFGDKYSLLNNGEYWEVQVQNLITNEIIKISYFQCKKSDPNKDCAQLQKNFQATAERTLVNSNWDKFYKLEWVNSRFSTNSNLFWYFINDAPEWEVSSLIQKIVFPSKKYVETNVIPKATKICSDWEESLTQVQNNSLVMTENGLAVQINWRIASGTAQCKIVIDPSSPDLWIKLSFTYNIDKTTVTNNTTNQTSNSAWNLNFNVKQFPINLEKTMDFKSSRWFTITFPSRNISYSSVNVDEDLGMVWVHCSSQMNIVSYANKDMVELTPAVKIYECTLKKWFNSTSNIYLWKTNTDASKNFIIEIVDPTWKDFATNITIQ